MGISPISDSWINKWSKSIQSISSQPITHFVRHLSKFCFDCNVIGIHLLSALSCCNQNPYKYNVFVLFSIAWFGLEMFAKVHIWCLILNWYTGCTCLSDPGHHLYPLHCAINHCLVSEHPPWAAGHRRVWPVHRQPTAGPCGSCVYCLVYHGVPSSLPLLPQQVEVL